MGRAIARPLADGSLADGTDARQNRGSMTLERSLIPQKLRSKTLQSRYYSTLASIAQR
jgi:hypothetical protein